MGWKNYVRREIVLDFIKSNPGVTSKEIKKHFHPNVRHTLRKLFNEGLVTRVKYGGEIRFFSGQAQLQNFANGKEVKGDDKSE